MICEVWVNKSECYLFFTFVKDGYLSNEGAFGVDPGDRFRAEIGAYIYIKAKADMNWDVLINMKINKYLNATLNTTLKYDNDVKTINDEGEKRGAKVQFKDILGIGVAYNF